MQRFLELILISLFISACGAGKKATSDDVVVDGSNPSVGVVTNESFYVRVFETGKFSYFMSKLGDFSTACEVKDKTTGTSLNCLVDIPELDLYYNGISFQYNFPATMCNYSLQRTYWHYNFEVGNGPTSTAVTQTRNAEGVLLSTTCVIDGVAGCTGNEAWYSAEAGKFQCEYDHSFVSGAPNCCMGEYDYTNTQIVDGVPSSTSSRAAWGGNIKGCIGGAGSTNWTAYSRDGYPRSLVKYIEGVGQNDKYEVSAPIKVANIGLTVPVANYYKPYDAASTNGNHRHTGYVDVRSSDLPYMVDPIDDRNGSSVTPGQPSYLFQCLDRNHEVINEIHVYVREWNTYKEFLLYGTSKGVSGNPDIAGDESGVGADDCDYKTGTGVCDDYEDLDYYKTPRAAALRYLYFPSSIYGD